jgi:carboxypeptidase Taq
VSQKHVVNVAQHGGMAAVLIAKQPEDLKIPKRSTSRADAAAEALRQQVAEIRHLDNIIALLEWDEEAMVPPEARDERGEQLATLEGLRHSLLTSDKVGDLIETVAVLHENDPRWRREIDLLRDERDYALQVPEDLLRELTVATSAALTSWEEARENGGFTRFAPDLANVVRLTRECAQALADGGDIYDPLLDENEPGMTRARLGPVLKDMRERLVPLVQQASELTRDNPFAGRKFPANAQWQLCRHIIAAIGFDFERGRLDRSTHPFTEYTGADDVRLTARTVTREDDLPGTVFAALHEAGHGLYDQGFAKEDRDWMLGDAPSMGMHEGQARLWENHVGRNAGFWQFLMPTLKDLFPDAMKGLDANAVYRAMNAVRPHPVRTGADELSYHLHIIMRYELEIALLTGDLTVRDLPGAWNEKSKAMLGAAPKTDNEGVLQDAHWAEGMFGYFPAYTIGSLYAAQMVETYTKGAKLDDEIRAGNFAGLLGWLRENVHRHGAMWPAEELVTRATGKGLDASAFFRHCENVVKSLRH